MKDMFVIQCHHFQTLFLSAPCPTIVGTGNQGQGAGRNHGQPKQRSDPGNQGGVQEE